jgi:uncharacterized protein (TIGR04255 family)
MPREVFAYPTVKEIDFEIRFPHVFSIENRIGDFQDKIVNQFPESKQTFRRRIMLADTGPEGKLVTIPEDFEPSTLQKFWVFSSPQGHEVKIQTNNLVITSHHHITYNNPTAKGKFRDTIKFVLTNFFEVVKIPIIKRIGLRYIDECPLPSKDNATLTRLYKSTFPIRRFPINDAEGVYFSITTKRKNHKLIYQEALIKKDQDYKLMLDFDGFETDIASSDFLRITDELHKIIEKEYFSIIREPVKVYMRTGRLE